MAESPRVLETSDPEQLFHAMVEIVDGLLVARGRYAVIEARRNRYVQVLTDADGALQVETVSNRFLALPDRPLPPSEEGRILSMAWRPPSAHSPNWHRTFLEPWPWPAPVAAELLCRTLLDVHDVHREPVTVTEGEAVPDVRVRLCDERCTDVASSNSGEGAMP